MGPALDAGSWFACFRRQYSRLDFAAPTPIRSISWWRRPRFGLYEALHRNFSSLAPKQIGQDDACSERIKDTLIAEWTELLDAHVLG